MKKNGFKRTLATLLVLTMVLVPLTACKKGGGEETDPSADYVYVPQYVQLPKEITDMSNVTCAGDTIYFLRYVTLNAQGDVMTQEQLNNYYERMEEFYASSQSTTADVAVKEGAASSTDVIGPSDNPLEEITNETWLCAVNTDGTNYRRLTDYKLPDAPEGDYSNSNLDRIMTDSQGNLWVIESVSQTIFDLPEGFDESTGNRWDYYVKDDNTYYARKLSDTGAELSSTCLTDFVDLPEGQSYFYINNIAIDSKGNLYFSDDSSNVYVISSEGSLLFKLSADGWINSMTQLKDGTVAVNGSFNEGGQELKVVDLDAKAWGKSAKTPNNAYNLFAGSGDYDFCYNDGSSLYGYNIATETETQIITWINNDINGDNVSFTRILDNGNLFTITNNYDDNGSNYEVAELVKTPASEVKQKEAVTLAVMYLDYQLRNAILDFNKNNPNYRIEVQDYSQYNTDEDYTAGATKLNTEIISGKIPDIIATYSLPYKQYAAKGLLEDVYTYIDNDSELSRDDLVQSIFKAMEIDGKLYTVASSFSIMSMVGKPGVVGAEPGWTMKELQQVVADHPEADYPLGMYMSREQIFNYLCALNMENYVDWSTGECSFDSDEFKSFLEFAKSFPASESMHFDEDTEWIDESVLISEGRMLMGFFSLTDFQNYQYTKATYGGDMIFKGLPTEEGVGNVASVDDGLAMTTSCKNKEAAWEFLRVLLTEDYQKSVWNLPTNKNAFDAKLADAMKQEYTTDENGNKVPVSKGGMSVNGGEVVEFYALTQEEADQILALVDSIQYTADYDESLLNIVNDESAAFFAGEKSVDEVASIIQSRMSIYINEQR